MKTLVLGLLFAACLFQSVARADDPIASTIRNRAIRKAKRGRALLARDIKESKQRAEDERVAEANRRRVMANEAHAAQVQHAINGHNANVVQAQSNQIQAQRNQVIAQQTQALQRARGVVICSNCGAYGHYVCAPMQKSRAVLEHEAMLQGMLIP